MAQIAKWIFANVTRIKNLAICAKKTSKTDTERNNWPNGRVIKRFNNEHGIVQNL